MATDRFFNTELLRNLKERSGEFAVHDLLAIDPSRVRFFCAFGPYSWGPFAAQPYARELSELEEWPRFRDQHIPIGATNSYLVIVTRAGELAALPFGRWRIAVEGQHGYSCGDDIQTRIRYHAIGWLWLNRFNSASLDRLTQSASGVHTMLEQATEDNACTHLLGVKTNPNMPVPDTMRAWVLGNPGELKFIQKPVPAPKRAEVLVRIDAVAICATDLNVIAHGPPAFVRVLPFNKSWTPGHEYMGTVAALGPGVDEFAVGDRVTVEIHAGCGQCKRCRMGMYTSCLNYGLNYGDVDKGHRANGFTTDGGFCEYAVNNINTLIFKIADTMSDEEATLVVTAGTSMYGLTQLGGLVAGESVVVTRPGPIGLLGVAVAKALGAYPVILTGTRDARLKKGLQLGADHVVNVTKENVVEAVCGGSTAARASTTSSSARARRTPSTRPAACAIAAPRSASPPFRTSR